MRPLFLVGPLPVLLLAAALLSAPPLAAQPALTGPEFFVDPASLEATPYAGQISHVVAATDAGGCLMVVWLDEAQPWQPRLGGRVFDASGRPVRPAFTLATGGRTLVSATLVPAAPAGFLLAWQTSVRLGNNTRYRLFARRLSSSGQPQGDVIPIRGPVTGISPGSMQTASASDGSFVVVWSEPNPQTSREDVFLRRFDAAGRPLAKAAPLPRDGGNKQRSALALMVLDDGELRIAWRSRSSDSAPPVLWVRRFDRNGAPLAAPIQVLPESADASSSSVIFGPDGGFLTTWTAWNHDDFLHLRAFAPDGTPFAEHQAAISWWYQVAAERGGTFLISHVGPYHCAVAGLQLEADGTPRGPVGCLTNPSAGNRGAFSATGTADGGFVLFWTESGRSSEQENMLRLFGQRLATVSPGTLQIERARSAVLESSPGPQELRILRRDGTAGTVSVDYRLTGAALGSGTVTFPDGDSTPRIISIPVSADDIPGNDRTVRVALSRPTGGAMLGLPRRAVVEVRDDDAPSPLLAQAEPPIALADAGEGSYLLRPGLAASPGGDFAAAWGFAEEHFPDRLDPVLQGVLFDAAALPTAAFETVCTADPLRVRIAMHPKGDFMVFWQSWAEPWNPTKPYDSFLQRFAARGAAAGPVVSLEYSVDEAAPLPKGRFVAVGRGHDKAGEGLFAHFLSANGIDLRSPVPIAREALQPESPSAVATDGIGRSVVVWSVSPTGAGPSGIFARRFDTLGSPLGPVFRVSQWESHDRVPSVATDVHGNFVVAWQRSWDGDGTGVYVRAFTAAETPLTDEIPVNSDTEGGQGMPSVALTGDGRFAVLWRSPSRVSGQLFGGDGKRLGSEAEIAPYPGTPTAVWSDRGFFMTIIFAPGPYFGSSIEARRLPL